VTCHARAERSLRDVGALGVDLFLHAVKHALGAPRERRGFAISSGASPRDPWYCSEMATAPPRMHGSSSASNDRRREPEVKLRVKVPALRVVWTLLTPTTSCVKYSARTREACVVRSELVWSSQHGLSFAGSGSLQFTVPLHETSALLTSMPYRSRSREHERCPANNARSHWRFVASVRFRQSCRTSAAAPLRECKRLLADVRQSRSPALKPRSGVAFDRCEGRA